jgi:hypothetical protein
MPDQDAREADLLAGPRGRELSAMLAGIDVEALCGQLAPRRSRVPLVADPADIAEREAVAGAEAAGEIEEPAVVAANPGDELFGIRELAAVAEGACYWGSSLAGADPLDDPALKRPGIEEPIWHAAIALCAPEARKMQKARLP